MAAQSMQIVAYGQASQRLTCPHYDEAVPANDVSVAILDSGGTSKATGTATKGAGSTTLGAAATAGDRQITVASVAGFAVGDPLVIASVDGRSEVGEVQGATGTTIFLRDRISRGYAITTSTVKSALIYYALDASTTTTWTIDTYYQAIFTNQNWSSPRAILFRIADLASRNPIRYEDVKRWYPPIDALRDGHDSDGLEEARDSAWDIISMRVEAAGHDPDTWRSHERVRSVGGLLAAGLFCVAHGDYDRAMQLVGDPPGAGGIFAAHWASTAQTLGWFDEDQDRAVDPGEKQRLGRGLLGRSL